MSRRRQTRITAETLRKIKDAPVIRSARPTAWAWPGAEAVTQPDDRHLTPTAPTSAEVGCTGNCWVHAPADEMCDHCRSVYYPDSADSESASTAQNTPGGDCDE